MSSGITFEQRCLVQRLLELVHGPAGIQDRQLRREYDITIESILISERDSAERFVNHLWYTILDQQRDVKDMVIPMMATLMLSGFHPDYVISHPQDAIEILTAVLTAYGHQQKYAQKDNDRLRDDGYYPNRIASRSQAIINTITAIQRQFGTWPQFKSSMLTQRSQLMQNDKLVNDQVRLWPFINSKSFRFFLRDIEPILPHPDMIPIPIDSNVAQSLQKTGLMHDQWPPALETVIPIEHRTDPRYERQFANQIKQLAYWPEENCGLCNSCDKTRCHALRIVCLAQSLFLLGMAYCQRCCTQGRIHVIPCPLNDTCMLSLHRNNPRIPAVLSRLEEK